MSVLEMTNGISRTPAGVVGGRILIVEDEPISRLLLELTLSDAGLDVRSAATREEAIAAAREFRPELIVTDISLADGSGIDLVREIREELPVLAVALTGRSREEMTPVGCTDGFEGWLTKPADMDHIRDVAVGLLGKRR